jgi:TorA maturation chaperone TorD
MRAPETMARQRLYRFLAHGYTYPRPAFHQGLRQPELWQQMQTVGEVLGPAVHSAIARLENGRRPGYGGNGPTLFDLRIEYTYLFINAVPHLPAPPYESAYSGLGLLMGEPVSQVLSAYREAGLDMGDARGLLPDHVVAELEFMAFLAGQEAATAQDAPAQARAWQARQQRFLAEHLLCWSPAFLTRIEKHARRPFYVQIADLTAALLRFEEQHSLQSASLTGRNA